MEKTIEEVLNESSAPSYEMEVIQPIDTAAAPGINFDFLKAQTGEGNIEEYILHPLNFNESKGMARVLRGLTGMFGSLSYALVDIVIGTLDLLKTSKKVGQKNGVRDFQ